VFKKLLPVAIAIALIAAFSQMGEMSGAPATPTTTEGK
jgi:hypothetical protein